MIEKYPVTIYTGRQLERVIEEGIIVKDIMGDRTGYR